MRQDRVFFFEKKKQKTFILFGCLCLLVAGVCHAAPFDPQAATEAYLNRLPAAARAKSDAYFEGGYWLILWDALYSIAVCWLLLATGISARAYAACKKTVRSRSAAIALYAIVFTVASFILSLPLDIYQYFFREHQYSLSNQDFAAWFGDHSINLAVSMVASALMIPAIYAVIRAAPRSWWLWSACVVMLFLFVLTALSPVFLEPLLNHFQPLAAGSLRDHILAMAHADGIPTNNVMEFDNSRQTDRISAHVSGFLGTTQISLNDNLIKQCNEDQILAVLGHEMGHYVMNHVFNFLLELALVIAAGFALIQWGFASINHTFGARWGVISVADPAGLPLLSLIITAYFLVLTPVTNTMTRTQEMQADIFGLNLARRPDAFAEMALKLSTYRKLSPSPLEEFIFFDHPSGRTRILTAMKWKAALMPAP